MADAQPTHKDWRSDCCGALMTTAGGDGSSMQETCWAVCRECRQPCDPVLVPIKVSNDG